MTPLIRAVWGTVLLVTPGAVLALTTDRVTSGTARSVLRVLGARHLAQAGIERRWPRPRVLVAAAVVDGLHASSGVVLAAADRRWRRSALLDAAVATGFCLATARSARRPSRSPG